MKLDIKNLKLKIWSVVIGLMVVLLAFYIAVPKSVEVETAVAKRGVFREVIKVDGIFRSKERHTVTSFADGDIKRVALKVGNQVKKGQVVAELFWDMHFQPIKSPIDGVISKVIQESAGPVQRGSPLVEIVDPEHLEIVAELLTTDAVRVKVGDPVVIENWGETIPLTAKVVSVSKAGFTKPSALGVEEEKTEVIAELADTPKSIIERLGSNFHVNLSIQISEVADALIVPIGATFRNGTKWSVYRVVNGRAHLIEIEIGAHNNDETVVIAGLRDGDKVVNFPGDLVKNGSKIKEKSK